MPASEGVSRTRQLLETPSPLLVACEETSESWVWALGWLGEASNHTEQIGPVKSKCVQLERSSKSWRVQKDGRGCETL